jgi:deoxycytidine triphosphate deaminase/intein/homing endonuclease
MILSDRDLRAALDSGRLRIEPLGENAIQPSSIDLRIGAEFRVFANNRHPYIDVRQPMDDLTDLVVVDDEAPFILHPGEFVLGTTFEKVTIPDDMVARLEGKSSLARLGLLIHSSLPGDEQILFRHEGETRLRPIEQIVRKQLAGEVVSFDPDTFEAIHAQVTGWYEGPADRIHEVVLASGRTVRVTAGHNLFTLDRTGEVRKVRTGELEPGTLVAVPRSIPDPVDAVARLDLLALAPESAWPGLVCEGPAVAVAYERHAQTVTAALADLGIGHVAYHRSRSQLPLLAARQVPALLDQLGPDDRLRIKGSKHGLPPVLEVDEDLAWLIGLYVAEGYRRRQQLVVANTDQTILDPAEAVLAGLGAPVYRTAGAVTACSTTLSALVDWLGMGGKARAKRLPHGALGWPRPVLASLLEGFVDGDGSREATRTSLWSSSPRLVDDLLLLCARLGHRASASCRQRRTGAAYQVSVPHGEHKLLTATPLPDQLLDPPVVGDLAWDRVVEVRDTGRREPIFDLEVRPDGRHVENFLAGDGGVFVSNTAGFVDAGWSGHLTLELSNVANLPITLYPGMKIGQLAFFPLTSPAEHPYGSTQIGSKYQGQSGPTASRYHENFSPRGGQLGAPTSDDVAETDEG